MNKVMLVGNVVKDTELQLIGEKGTPKVQFTIACNERLGGDKEDLVNFIPCVIWGKMAEALVNYLVKGTKVAVSGRLDIRNVESEEYENEWKTYVSINVSELDFCGGRKEESQPKQQKQEKAKKERKKK